MGFRTKNLIDRLDIFKKVVARNPELIDDDLDTELGQLSMEVFRSLYKAFKKDLKNRCDSGEFYYFYPRGIGSDHTPGCFCCGGPEQLYDNISGFVESKEHGEAIVKLFKYGAWLDYRPDYPDRVQVKIGACKEHLDNLKLLYKKTSGDNLEYGVWINQLMVDQCDDINYDPTIYD